MNFHVMTLFPEMIEQALQTSILGRAIKNGCIGVKAVNIRDYTKDKHKKVDDYPYGGGAGMLIQAQPVYDCFQAVRADVEQRKGKAVADRLRVVYLTPQGQCFHQALAGKLAEEEELVFLCGHYEGVDERVLEEIVTDYLSIGDYVLTGGELPALVIMDAVARLVPGVLHNEVSADLETFHDDLLEYPQYSRPVEWHGKRVPEVLLSGDHKKVDEWRREQSRERTKCLRPDLYEKYQRRQEVIHSLLKKNKALYIDMTEALQRGREELIYAEDDGVIVGDRQTGICRLAAFSEKAAVKLVKRAAAESKFNQYVLHQPSLLVPLEEMYQVEGCTPFRQAVYNSRIAPTIKKRIEIRSLTPVYQQEILQHSSAVSESCIKEQLEKGRLFGAFVEENLAGFAGLHQGGGLGLLYVDKPYRRKGIGRTMLSYLISQQLSEGLTPYAVAAESQAALALFRQLGMKLGKESVYWVKR